MATSHLVAGPYGLVTVPERGDDDAAGETLEKKMGAMGSKHSRRVYTIEAVSPASGHSG